MDMQQNEFYHNVFTPCVQNRYNRGVDMSRHRARERREARDNKDTSVIYKENSCLDRKLPTLLLIDTRLFFYSVHIYNKPPSPEKLFS